MFSFQETMSFAESLFATQMLGRHYKGPEKGVDRAGYSQEETQAFNIISSAAKAMGCQTYQDLAGNIHCLYRGRDPEASVLMIGSHMDAVPRGGQFDGPAGVVAGLAAIHKLHINKLLPERNICLTMWRAEESPAFGQFGIGSGLAAGKFNETVLDKTNKNGDSLHAALDLLFKEKGTDHNQSAQILKKDFIQKCRPLLPFDSIACAIEAHIEQEKTLAKKRIPFGFVDAIRGNLRFPQGIDFHGIAGHTGSANPLTRKDSGLMTCRFVATLEALFNDWRTNGRDITLAAPIIQQKNNSPTTIPDHTKLFLDIRSTDQDVLDQAYKELIVTYHETTAWQQTGAMPISRTKPTRMDEDLIKQFQKTAKHLRLHSCTMNSGAGHDIMNLAPYVPTALLLFAHEGQSHVPSEKLGMGSGHPFATNSDYGKLIRFLSYICLNPPISVKRPKASFENGLIERGAIRL